MPSWKKVVASGSDASFSSVSVDTYVSASSFKGSFTGSLEGTASQAISSSYALTASYALFAANGGGGGISAIYIQDEGITQGTASYFNFYGAGVTATVSDSTASINIPGGGGGTTNNASNAVLNQSSPAVTWSFTHNLGAKYPVFTVFDSSDNVIIPQQIHAVDTSSALIYFSTARTGTAVASVAGNVLTSSYSISSSYAYTASSAVSASFAFTASSANSFNVRNSLTASGLRYPTADGTYASQVIQTDASGNLSFGDVQTTFDNVYNGEATTLVKGTPVYISGSNGANPKVFRADAADANKMPVTYIVSENISAGNVGRGITLGHIEGIDLTGYPAGTSVYVNSGGGWTSTRPTGSNVTIQFLGLVTKEGSGGKGLVLNPGPVVLPNIQAGYTWVGNGNSYPVAVTTSSLLVTSASYAFTASSAISSSLAQTASYVLNAVSSSYAYTASSAINASSSLIAVSASYAATSSYATNFTASNILVTGTITAQTLVVSTISSSVAYSSGSNIFGNSTANTQTFTGSVNITGSLNLNGKATLTDLTGSLFGTSSWAQNALTASYVTTAQTASYVLNAVSSSKALSASYSDTASFANSFNVAGNLTASNAVLSGTLTAQTLVVQTITSSIDFVTGSTRFGSLLTNTHTFTGSIYQTGSIAAFAGSVGIGTTNPSVPLEVYLAGGGPTVRITNSGTGVGTGNGFHIGSDISSPYNASLVQNEVASIAFYTNDGSSVAERMRITASGSVGVAVTPSTWDNTTFKGIQIAPSNAFIVGRVDNVANQLQVGSNAYYNADGNWKFIQNGYATRYLQNGGTHAWDCSNASGTAGNNVTFITPLTITVTGNVGIGITNPNYTLDVNKSVAGDFVARILNSSSTGYGLYIQTNDNSKPGIRIANASGATKIDLSGTGQATFNATDDGIGQYFWFTGNAAVNSNFSIYAYSNNVYINAYQTMVIRANQGTTGGSIQLSGGVVFVGGASITNSGSTMNVIGTSTSLPLSRFFVNAVSSQSYPCIRCDKYDATNGTTQVFIDFTVNNQASGNGSITGNGASQVTFTTWSDRRLKENITNLPSQLSNIMALRPVEFDYKNGSGHQIGFIAQEVQEIYPDIVGENAEGYLTISGLSKMESRLIKAIQELKAEIDELKNK